MHNVVFYNADKYARMLGELLEADTSTMKQFMTLFKKYGLLGFFEHADELDVPHDLINRVKTVREIMMLTHG